MNVCKVMRCCELEIEEGGKDREKGEVGGEALKTSNVGQNNTRASLLAEANRHCRSSEPAQRLPWPPPLMQHPSFQLYTQQRAAIDGDVTSFFIFSSSNNGAKS